MLDQIHFNADKIEMLEQRYRANLINSITGYKPANLIGTRSADGFENLAIISSVVHLGSDPALIGFVQRPLRETSHTYKNILETGFYTINHVAEGFVDKAHYTSARFEREESEFEACKLRPQYMEGFLAPFVAESPVNIGLRFEQEILIDINQTRLIIGRIEHIFLDKNGLGSAGNIQIDALKSVAVSGLDTYYSGTWLNLFPYAKKDKLPYF